MTIHVHRRFHLEYTKAVDFLSWAELECLSKALGIPHSVLTGLCSAVVPPEASGISVEQFHDVYTTKDFQEAMNFAYNFHSYEWNSEVIKTAIYIVTRRGLSFDELRTIRTSYAFYEQADTKGMKIEEQTLIRCLKMCNRVISPRKMMHRLKHMKDRFEVTGRIQLSEFLELILWCDLYTAWSARVKQWELAEGKDEKLMWLLNEFYDFLYHQDAKLQHLLDKQYIKDEWSFKKERLNISHRFHGPPVSPELRLRYARRQRQSYTPIRIALRQSEMDVRRGAAGGYYHEMRPSTAPDFLRRRAEAEQQQDDSVQQRRTEERPKSARQLMAEHFTTPEPVERRDETAQTKEKKERPKTAPIVRPEEKEALEEIMDAIEFDQSTVDVRYDNYMHEDLEYLRPGFWRRAAQRNSQHEEKGPQESPKRRVFVPQRPSNEFVRRIASPRSRQPLPAHGRACDARYRGWKPSSDNVRSIHHQAVLVSPAYERSNSGAMLQRMYRTDADILRKLHGDSVVLRVPKSERRHFVHPTATETIPPEKPHTKPPDPRKWQTRDFEIVTRRVLKSYQRCKEDKKTEPGGETEDRRTAEIRQLRARLLEGLSVRRAVRKQSLTSRTPVQCQVTICEDGS